MEKQADQFVTNFTLSTPSRLHFGLYGVAGEQRFGGLGLMVNHPILELTCTASSRFEIHGYEQELVRSVVNVIRQKNTLPVDPLGLPIRLQILKAPPRHSGLGSGTQIAFAVAAALLQCLGIPQPPANVIAELVNRGKRSAIGSHGFYSGGCIADSGVSDDATFSPIEKRVDFPPDWPIVLIRPLEKAGLHGQHEQAAFDRLRDGEVENRERLKELAIDRILPGIESKDYQQFANALHEFNRVSGEYFSQFQSGAYNSPRCAKIVDFVLDRDCPAVGQSSWGPTLFAVASEQKLADDLVRALRKDCPSIGDEKATETIITNANNRGMKIVNRQEH